MLTSSLNHLSRSNATASEHLLGASEARGAANGCDTRPRATFKPVPAKSRTTWLYLADVNDLYAGDAMVVVVAAGVRTGIDLPGELGALLRHHGVCTQLHATFPVNPQAPSCGPDYVEDANESALLASHFGFAVAASGPQVVGTSSPTAEAEEVWLAISWPTL